MMVAQRAGAVASEDPVAGGPDRRLVPAGIAPTHGRQDIAGTSGAQNGRRETGRSRFPQLEPGQPERPFHPGRFGVQDGPRAAHDIGAPEHREISKPPIIGSWMRQRRASHCLRRTGCDSPTRPSVSRTSFETEPCRAGHDALALSSMPGLVATGGRLSRTWLLFRTTLMRSRGSRWFRPRTRADRRRRRRLFPPRMASRSTSQHANVDAIGDCSVVVRVPLEEGDGAQIPWVATRRRQGGRSEQRDSACACASSADGLPSIKPSGSREAPVEVERVRDDKRPRGAALGAAAAGRFRAGVLY